MSKLEAITEILTTNSNIVWTQEEAYFPYSRSRSGYYYSTGLRVFPKQPLPDAQSLKKLSKSIIKELIPIGPSSISHCYIFPARRQAIRLAALYFFESVDAEQDIVERHLVVSIYPCEGMARNVGYRAIVEIGGYECPELCKVANKCIFKASKYKFLKKLF